MAIGACGHRAGDVQRGQAVAVDYATVGERFSGRTRASGEPALRCARHGLLRRGGRREGDDVRYKSVPVRGGRGEYRRGRGRPAHRLRLGDVCHHV